MDLETKMAIELGLSGLLLLALCLWSILTLWNALESSGNDNDCDGL